MTPRRHPWAAATLGLAASLMALAAGAQPAPRCFHTRDWNGWKATPDAKAIYLRVGVRQVYRLDFGNACSAVTSPGSHLVVRQHSGGWICGPLDLDLSVSTGHGFRTPCLVSKITPLSDEDAKALPKALRP
jgi:hypothetical protein